MENIFARWNRFGTFELQTLILSRQQILRLFHFKRCVTLQCFSSEASEHPSGELGHPKPREVIPVALLLAVKEDFSAEACGYWHCGDNVVLKRIWSSAVLADSSTDGQECATPLYRWFLVIPAFVLPSVSAWSADQSGSYKELWIWGWSSLCVVQSEGACLHSAGLGRSVSFLQGWRSLSRWDAEQHQEPEECWCCSEGVDVTAMVSVVLGPAAERGSGLSCLGEPGFDVLWLPDLPDHGLSAKFFSLTFPSQHLRRAAWKKGRSLNHEKGEAVLVSFQLQGTLSLIFP